MLKEASTLIAIGIFVCIVVGGYLSHFFLGNDNPIEQTAEALIEKDTGIKIDLTPESPEIPPPSRK